MCLLQGICQGFAGTTQAERRCPLEGNAKVGSSRVVAGGTIRNQSLTLADLQKQIPDLETVKWTDITGLMTIDW